MSSQAQPLRYLIGLDADPGEAGAVTVIGYNAETLPINGVGYINCRQEAKGRRAGIIYIDPPDDIEREYGEPAIRFGTLSFWDNLDPQISKWKRLGASAVEIDNLDTYDVTAAVKMFNRVRDYQGGMGVFVKNPNLLDGDNASLIRHPSAERMIIEHDKDVTAGGLDKLRRDGGKPDLPIHVVTHGDQRPWAQQIANQAIALGLKNFSVTHSPGGEYTSVDHILSPSEQNPMAYSLTWLPQVLRAAGLKVEETPGWQSRGHGDMGKIQGVLCHHTSGAKTGNMPSLNVLIEGRSDLAGPLSQLGLGRDGTYYMVCAGKGWHAGSGGYKGITDGNSHLIGIEAENTGLSSDPWPDVQMDAYRRGVAAILQHIGATADYAVAHKEWTPRKPDPSFDFSRFRAEVATLMAGGTIEPMPDTADNRPVLGKGDTGKWVEELQKALGVKVDGDFGNETDSAVRIYQASRGLAVDGVVGRDTWAALMADKPPVSNPTTESGKGSWYSQYKGKYVWVDTGDAPGSAALGVPDDAQGVAFYNQATLGKWFAVTAPNGVTSIEQQTDIGPHPRTGRLIDICAAAAERFGYSPKNFPTDSIFSWRPVPAPSAVASLTPQQQAVKWRDLRGTPQPDPEPEPVPDNAVLAQILAEIKALNARLTKLEQAPAPVSSRSDWIEVIAGIGSGLERLPEIVDAADRLIARGPQIVSMIERIGQVIERFAPLIGMFTGRQSFLPTYVVPPQQYQPSPPPAKSGSNTAVIATSAAGGGAGFAVLIMEILSKLAQGG